MWHRRIGHAGAHVQELVKNKQIETPLVLNFCDTCATSKSQRLPFKNKSISAKSIGEFYQTSTRTLLNQESNTNTIQLSQTHSVVTRYYFSCKINQNYSRASNNIVQ